MKKVLVALLATNRVDSTVGDDRKSSKTINANDEAFLMAA